MDCRSFLAAGLGAALSGVHARAGAGRHPVAFTVEVRVKPGRESEFLDLLTPVLDGMRHEPTFINAFLNRDPDDPSRFLIYETWADLDDVLEVQIKRPYRAAYLARLPALLAEDRAIRVWRPLRADVAAPT